MNKLIALLGWVDDRFPLTKMWKEHLAEYYAPKNFNPIEAGAPGQLTVPEQPGGLQGKEPGMFP